MARARDSNDQGAQFGDRGELLRAAACCCLLLLLLWHAGLGRWGALLRQDCPSPSTPLHAPARPSKVDNGGPPARTAWTSSRH